MSISTGTTERDGDLNLSSLTFESGGAIVDKIQTELSTVDDELVNAEAIFDATYGGMTWTYAIPPDIFYQWTSITYGNGLFVSISWIGGTNAIMTSPDGINWTSRDTPLILNGRGITYGNGLFVAVGTDSVITSPDGINWTNRTPASDNNWWAITYGNGLFVAVAYNGTSDRVMTSPDGITWTSRTVDNETWYDITYGNNLFVVVGHSKVMTSPDGITWTNRTPATTNDWWAVEYGNGLFVVVGRSGIGDRVMTSPDGITWTSRTSAEDNSWQTMTYGNGLFIAVALNGINRVMLSLDGINWITKYVNPESWLGITYGDGLFVAVGTDTVMVSGKKNNVRIEHDNVYQGINRNMRGFDRLNPDQMGIPLYTAGTRTFSLYVKSNETHFYFYTKGKQYIKTTTQSIVWPDVSGIYYFYFDLNGDLQYILDQSMTESIFVQSALCGLVYWDAVDSVAWGAKDEQHGIIMDASTHFNMHLTRHFKWSHGGEGIGVEDNSSTYTSITTGIHFDEDIINISYGITSTPFMYREGANGEWKITSADLNIGHIESGNTYTSWNEYDDSVSPAVWQLTECTNSTDYVIMMMVKTNFETHPYRKIIGQTTYSSRNNARNGLKNELHAINLFGLPSTEVEFQFAWIAKRNGDLEDDGDGNVAVDLRGVNINSFS